MKRHDDGSLELPRKKEDILKIFEKYNFRDEHGHPLLMCEDFLQLVNAACNDCLRAMS